MPYSRPRGVSSARAGVPTSSSLSSHRSAARTAAIFAGPMARARLSVAVLALAVLVPALFVPATVLAEAGYIRTPDVFGDRLVFSAEGDLWLAKIDGTDARRLTMHPGDEYLPKFSPDGAWIAFAGDYDGNRDLFVIPATGGEPRRMTWHPAPDEPVCWTPEGARLVFRSTRQNPHWDWELYAIPVEGGEPEKLPIGYAQNLSIDPVTGRWAFNRTSGGGTWKRYRGGTASDIWVGDPRAEDYAKITDFDGSDLTPVWLSGKLYFLSDKGGTQNLWVINSDGTERHRLSPLDGWDLRQLETDGSKYLTYTIGGDLHLYNSQSNVGRKIKIDLPSERILTRTRYPNPQQYLNGFALAPDGDRVAIEARGEIFSLPVKKEGITLPLSGGSGSREDRMSYDPKGERLLYVTDASGEEAILSLDAWGRGEPKVIVPSGDLGRVNTPSWSPDGKWIAWSDQAHSLWLAPADGGPRVRVDRSEQWEIGDYTFSPDGRWLAYSKLDRRDRPSIWIYDTREKTTRIVTDWTTPNRTPAWDPAGRYLYFVSDRVINPIIGDVDFETVELTTSKVCALLLRPDVKNPTLRADGAPPGPDAKMKEEEERKKAAAREEKAKSGKADEEPPEAVVIDFDGIESRVVELPIEAGRYYALAASPSKLFYWAGTLGGLMEEKGDFPERKGGTLFVYDLEERESRPFLSEVVGFDLQNRSGKIGIRKAEGEIFVLDAGAMPGDDLSKSSVSLENVVIELDPREEWSQMFHEAWRYQRDYYWDEGMGGVDWKSIRDQYASLLPRLATRADLQDLIAEMISELATSHTYVWGGDRGVNVPAVSTGLLGADLVREGNAFRVGRILRGAAADRVRSPLDEPGSIVNEGEYILEVNNRAVPANEPFEASLAGWAGKPVLLTVNSRPSKDGARTVVCKPMSGGMTGRLRYHDWVRRNREAVTEKTGGKIGYVHIPDMGGWGLRQWDTWFYNQLDKEGMVIDARWNGGGFVSQLVVSRLLRQLMWWDRSRGGNISTYPYRTLNGPFVVLTNEFAGSDGDIFPAAIKTAGVAPVIGKRSWGGVIGIRGGVPLVDKGGVSSPEFAWWHPTKGWGIENYGVDPDIEIDNLPQQVGHGIDAQLDRGIEEVLRLREAKPPLKPEFGPVKDRSRRAFKMAEMPPPVTPGQPTPEDQQQLDKEK